MNKFHARAQRSLDEFTNMRDPFQDQANTDRQERRPSEEAPEEVRDPFQDQANTDRQERPSEEAPEEVDDEGAETMWGHEHDCDSDLDSDTDAAFDPDKFYNSPMAWAAESNMAYLNNVPWQLRGPPGPQEGGPTRWRGQPYRPQSGKWMKRGGKRVNYWNELYRQKGRGKAKGKGKGGEHENIKGKGKGGKQEDIKGKGKGRGSEQEDIKGKSHKGKGKGDKGEPLRVAPFSSRVAPSSSSSTAVSDRPPPIGC